MKTTCMASFAEECRFRRIRDSYRDGGRRASATVGENFPKLILPLA